MLIKNFLKIAQNTSLAFMRGDSSNFRSFKKLELLTVAFSIKPSYWKRVVEVILNSL